MKFRPAKVEEAEQISEVFKSVYKDEFPYTDPAEIRKDLKEEEIFSLVVEKEAEIIGFGQLKPPNYSLAKVKKGALIARIAFKPAYQNQGLGTELINRLNERLETRETNYVLADLQTINCHSQKLFAKFGFKPVGCLVGLVPDFIVGNTNLTVILAVKLKDKIKTPLTVYLPADYKQLGDFIYNNFFLVREVKTNSRVSTVDNKFKEQVANHLSEAQKMEKQDNYNYQFFSVDITSPQALSKINYARKQGLEVEGLIPNLTTEKGIKDFLMLRKRPEQIEYDKIAVLEGANKQFFQLVR